MKNTLKNIFLVAVVLVVCALLLEAMTRLLVDDGMTYELEMWKYATDVKVRDFRPEQGHRHGVNRSASLMSVPVRTNEQGFRGPAIAKLQAEGRKVDGFNEGVGNWNTTQELTNFREVGLAMKPDIVVLTYFINDAEPMPSYPNETWLDRHSAAWIVLNYRLDSLIRQFGPRPDWKHYYRNLYNDSAPGWQATQKAIASFGEIARNGTRIVVFHLPELRELKPYPFQDVTDKVRKVVEANGLPFVDLLPTVETMDPASLWVTVPDPHPNARADTAFTGGMIKALTPILDELCQSQKKGC